MVMVVMMSVMFMFIVIVVVVMFMIVVMVVMVIVAAMLMVVVMAVRALHALDIFLVERVDVVHHAGDDGDIFARGAQHTVDPVFPPRRRCRGKHRIRRS